MYSMMCFSFFCVRPYRACKKHSTSPTGPKSAAMYTHISLYAYTIHYTTAISRTVHTVVGRVSCIYIYIYILFFFIFPYIRTGIYSFKLIIYYSVSQSVSQWLSSRRIKIIIFCSIYYCPGKDLTFVRFPYKFNNLLIIIIIINDTLEVRQ